MILTQEEIKGSIDRCDDDRKEYVYEIVAAFHFRNGIKNLDGSLGEIYISPKQFQDAIAYAILNYQDMDD